MLQKTNKNSSPYILATVVCLTMFGSILLVQCTRPNIPKTATAEVKSDSVYTYVDSMPKPGYDIPQFIGEYLKYPDAAKAQKIEGTVVILFVVDENGKITDISVAKSPDSTLSVAALDVIKKMPDWKPGVLHGQKVKVSFTLPISFKLD